MKQFREYSIKIAIVVFVLGVYLFACKYQNEDYKLNDMSVLASDCKRDCQNSLDLLRCLDSCAISDTNTISRGYSAVYAIISTILIFILTITYHNEVTSLFEHVKDRLGYNSKYNKINIDNENEEDEMYHYKKITDI